LACSSPERVDLKIDTLRPEKLIVGDYQLLLGLCYALRGAKSAWLSR